MIKSVKIPSIIIYDGKYKIWKILDINDYFHYKLVFFFLSQIDSFVILFELNTIYNQ